MTLKNIQPLVCYHAKCNDGLAAAYVLYMQFGDHAEYLPLDYGRTMPTPDEVVGRDVYVVDFSFDPLLTSEIINASNHFFLFDHHKSAKDKLSEHWDSIKTSTGIHQSDVFLVDDNLLVTHHRSSRNNAVIHINLKKSAAVLTWEYFNKNKPIPSMYQYIQDYDLGNTFKGKALPETEHFIANFTLGERNISDFKEAFLKLNQEENLKRHLNEGKLLSDANKSLCAQIITQYAHPIVMGGVNGLCINGGQLLWNELCNQMASKSGTFGMTWDMQGDFVKISLRSKPGFDVSEIAKQYGGGGHPQSSGILMSTEKFLSTVLNFKEQKSPHVSL